MYLNLLYFYLIKVGIFDIMFIFLYNLNDDGLI